MKARRIWSGFLDAFLISMLVLFLFLPFLPALASGGGDMAQGEGEAASMSTVGGEEPWEVTSLDIWKDVDEVRSPGWDIDLEKTVSETDMEMHVGETREVTFTIGVEAFQGGSYYVAGNIFVENTGEWPADVVAVSDTVWYKAGGPSWLPATSSITTTVPLGNDAIPTGGPHVYSYSGTFTLPVPLDSVTALSNLIEITISNKPDPPKPGMQEWTFHSREPFDKPAAGGSSVVSLSDVEWMVPGEGLDYEIKSVTINGSPASSLTGPWDLDLEDAPFTLVVKKELTARKAGEYTLHNKAVIGELEDEVEVDIVVRDEEPEEGEILGYKYEDLDLDGQLGQGDVPWEGITIQLWKDGERVGEAVTASDGSFRFTGLQEGEYEVREVLPEGTAAVGSASRLVLVEEGEVSYPETPFLNYWIPEEENGSIGGTKYLDLDADGLLDEREPGLSGVTIRLYRAEDADLAAAVTLEVASSWVLVGETSTGASGEFSFGALPPGLYRVEEVVSSGYYATSPAWVDLELQPGGEERVDFLNALLASVGGYKWLDLDGDGQADENEPGLAGVTVRLLGDDGEVLDTRVTTQEGYYLFGNLEPGEYAVEELVPQGYEATAPTKVSFELLPGEEERVDFLNAVVVGGEVVTPPVTPPIVPVVSGGTGTLPATGLAMTLLLVGIGILLSAGVLLLSLGALRRRLTA